MAKVWFAKGGDNPTLGEAVYELALSGCIMTLHVDPSFYRGLEPPRFASSGMDDFVGYRYVVIEVDQCEAIPGWRAGYYVLPMTPAEAMERLSR
ncbi:carbamoyl phosphate synthase small subunit [Bradyrhizobium oligotrophicum S58]|uniref:Carbamoyl phosphate synthase small subunit n=1 Tax=Bradyrhizobium oligotrophicum S58 TaxID=1245469 RepID=M4ZAN9_9BRAD|nr:hypothetical protein [Bradyrhizobium oligotrophicum]BAM90436.1 carbamoyl phosphate synthase small subunit [Bradyrhizobium oligotrophicum S58]